MGRFRSRLLLTTALALLAALLAAPSAFAVAASVRVEGTSYRVAPYTGVNVRPSGTLDDTDGTTFAFTSANALEALDVLADLDAFTYDFNMDFGAPFLTSIAGLTADPGTWADGWTYFVNGVGWPILDMGAGEFPLQDGDKVVFAQNPDASFSRGTKLLRMRFDPSIAPLPGQTLILTVFGDNAAKANNATEARRFGLDPDADPSVVETSSQWAPVPGAIVHVGARVYTDGANGDAADGSVTVSGLPRGSYRVWAERPMDDAFSYVRSAGEHLDVAPGPDITKVTARAAMSGGRLTARVAFTLDKRAKVRIVMLNGRPKVVATIAARTLTAGRHSLSWSGRPGGAIGAKLTFRIKATDAAGRATAVEIRVPVAR